ncbi:hypothetical protein BJF78_29485 [Pseudonocardia sp. CNS-139]|nr:hypothetical protein BJF78_29485 [Pseudonocardia sp. CNS-139]
MLARRLRADVEQRLATHGMSMRHLSALGHLAREPGLSYTELGRRADVTAQSMQATLRHLEEHGAVERRTEAGRGRTARLHVTELGARLIAESRAVFASVDRDLLAGLDPEQQEAVTTSLMLLAGMAGDRRPTAERALR